MKILDIVSIFVVLANLSLGTFVWWKGRKKKANIWFFCLTISIAGWVFANWLSIICQSYSAILWTGRLTFAFAALIPILLINFFIHFPKTLNFSLKYLICLDIVGIIFIFISGGTALVVKDVNLESTYNNIYRGSLYHIFAIYFLFYIITAFILLFSQYRRSVQLTRLKLRYVIYSFLIASFIGTFTNLIWPEIIYFIHPGNFYNLDAEALPSVYGPLFTIIMIGGMSYSIIKYRLMDIRLIIRRGVVHFLSIAIILFLYLYLLFFTQKYFVEKYNWNEQTSLIILVLAIVLTIEPLRRFLFRVVDKVFYSKQKNAREEAKKLRLVLSSSVQFDQLVKKVKTELQSFLDTQTAQFLWNNKRNGRLENYYKDETPVSFSPTDPLFHYLQEHPDVLITEEIPYMVEEASSGDREILLKISENLKKIDVGLVCPIGEKGELVGAFLFSPKSRKEAFTSDNVEYLSGLQFSLTGAMANALLYKQAVERIAKLK